MWNVNASAMATISRFQNILWEFNFESFYSHEYSFFWRYFSQICVFSNVCVYEKVNLKKENLLLNFRRKWEWKKVVVKNVCLIEQKTVPEKLNRSNLISRPQVKLASSFSLTLCPLHLSWRAFSSSFKLYLKELFLRFEGSGWLKWKNSQNRYTQLLFIKSFYFIAQQKKKSSKNFNEILHIIVLKTLW